MAKKGERAEATRVEVETGTIHHMRRPARREGYVEEVVYGRDTRGRWVPVAIAMVPESWAKPDEFVLRRPDIPVPVAEGLSSRDRVDLAGASAEFRKLESEFALWRLGPTEAPRPREKGSQPPTDAELAGAAEVYLAAQIAEPNKPIVEMQRLYAEGGIDVDLDTLRHHVRMARLNRYLTPSTRGKAGAEADSALIAWRERQAKQRAERKGKKS